MRQLLSLFRSRQAPHEALPVEAIEGYEHAELVDLVFQKAKVFKPTEEWPAMAGVSSVLDFGGGCGHHYKSAVRYSPNVRWAIVETPAMAKRGSELATDNLRFFTSIPDAKNWLGSVEVMHSNGALQYTPDPLQTLELLCGLEAKAMHWNRLYLSSETIEHDVQVSRLIDNGPGSAPASTENKPVKYTRTKIPEPVFLQAHSNYALTERGSDWFRFDLR